MDQQEIRAHGQQCGLFQQFTQDVVERIISRAVVLTLQPNHFLFTPGSQPAGYYGVLSGEIKLRMQAGDGKEFLVGIVEPGKWFGEIALFDNLPYAVQAISTGQSEILLLRRTDVMQLFDDYPHAYKPIILDMCRRQRVSLSLIQDATFLDLPIRLAKRLLTLADTSGERSTQGITFKHRLSQEQLSQMLCVSRQSINKVMKEWQVSGWVKVEYGNIILTDPEALEEYVTLATKDVL